jgi:hypothetical protein
LTRVACTGHQYLDGPTRCLVTDDLTRILGALEPPLIGLTSLAEGADQVFAAVVLAVGGRLHAVIPSAGYEGSFTLNTALDDFRSLRDRAEIVTALPNAVPNEDAYLAAGRFMVDACDFLIAIWDNQPARGPGGTGDVAAYARRKGVPMTVVWPTGAKRA